MLPQLKIFKFSMPTFFTLGFQIFAGIHAGALAGFIKIQASLMWTEMRQSKIRTHNVQCISN
jgi:flagellar biosynthesis protein FliR